MIFQLNKNIVTVIMLTLLFMQFVVLILYINNIHSFGNQINQVQVQIQRSLLERQTFYNEQIKRLNEDINYYGDRDGFVPIEGGEVKQLN